MTEDDKQTQITNCLDQTYACLMAGRADVRSLREKLDDLQRELDRMRIQVAEAESNVDGGLTQQRNLRALLRNLAGFPPTTPPDIGQEEAPGA